MRKLLVLLIVITVAVGGAYLLLPSSSKPAIKELSSEIPTPTNTSLKVDYSASFAIFTNGTFRIFTDPRYHNRSEDVYIDANNPYVIQIRKTGITWGDFFATLPMKVTSSCLTTGTGQEFCNNETHTLKFYVNNIPVSDALSREIQPQDKLLISYGPKSDPAIENQLQQVLSD